MFSGAVYVIEGNTLPLDSFSVEVLPDFPAGGVFGYKTGYPI
jgi:hypothetical protein